MLVLSVKLYFCCLEQRMISKSLSIILISFASLLLLAHDMIPHHHQEDHICFDHGTCAYPHSNDSENERNQKDEDDPCCSLAGLFFINSSSRTEETPCTCCDKTHHKDYQEFFLLKIFGYSHLMYHLPLPFREHPLRSSFFDAFISLSSGLRAPPVA